MSTISDRAGHAKPVQFVLYWRAALIVSLVVGFISIGIRLAAPQSIGVDNAFSEYADILPGHPKEIVETRGFNCQRQTNYYASDFATCTLTPKQGAFSRIEVFAANDVIIQSTFYAYDYKVYVGDLMLGMGITNLYQHRYDLAFFWSTLYVTIKTSQLKRSVGLRSLSSVTFTDVNYHWPQTTIQGGY